VVAILNRFQCLFLHVSENQQHARTSTVLEFLNRISKVTGCPLHQYPSDGLNRPTIDDLLHELKVAAKNDDRRFLLIAGIDLEDQVTVCALKALFEGFDVHLLCDAIISDNIRLEPILLSRLYQAGAVLSSLR
jgi:hypothetical protein